MLKNVMDGLYIINKEIDDINKKILRLECDLIAANEVIVKFLNGANPKTLQYNTAVLRALEGEE